MNKEDLIDWIKYYEEELVMLKLKLKELSDG